MYKNILFYEGDGSGEGSFLFVFGKASVSFMLCEEIE